VCSQERLEIQPRNWASVALAAATRDTAPSEPINTTEAMSDSGSTDPVICPPTAPFMSIPTGTLKLPVDAEVVISRIQAKAKLSQNKSPADVAGVIDGLIASGDTGSAAAVRAATESSRS
jgi:predicted FMN-binding regulatory protein PaiB